MWANDGVQALDPGREASERRNSYRDRSLRHLRELIRRLDFQDNVTRPMMNATRLAGGDVSSLPESLRIILLGSLRRYGYIYQDAHREWQVTPMRRGQQLHIMRLLADGWDTDVVAQTIATGRDNVNSCIRRAMEQERCNSRVQLMADCYRRGWLPDRREENAIRRNGLRPCIGYLWVTPGAGEA